MTLLFQKSNFCGNFFTFLEVSKLLITNYFLNATYRQGADHKKVLAVEITGCVSDCKVFVMASPFWHYRGVTSDWLIMLDFQPVKTGFA